MLCYFNNTALKKNTNVFSIVADLFIKCLDFKELQCKLQETEESAYKIKLKK